MTQSDQRVAIVTGAAGGIGAATAAVLAEAGLAVVLADWQAAPVEQQAQALRDRGFPALGLAADISRRAEVERPEERQHTEGEPERRLVHIVTEEPDKELRHRQHERHDCKP